ncbi:MAG: hypothetical protein L0Y54_08300 [Sporichthyaceae bacterium]|nr:hypothetical protein [Sporichthyaceae bacterium]
MRARTGRSDPPARPGSGHGQAMTTFSGVARYTHERPDIEEMVRTRNSARLQALERLRDFELRIGATFVERSASDCIIYGPGGILHVYRITGDLL